MRRLAVFVLCLPLGCDARRGERAAPADVDASSPGPPPVAEVAPSASAAVSSRPPEVVAPASAAHAARVLELGVPVTQVYPRKRHQWRRLSQVNWQAFDVDPPAMPPDVAPNSKGCPAGMLRVEGAYLVGENGEDDDRVLLRQNQACTEWRSDDHGIEGLCARFDAAAWAEKRATLGRRAMNVCVDRFEYPNRRGELPVIVSTYSESKAYCEREHKRLCTESEWTFACEGEEGRPFPYGYDRDPTACNFENKVPLDIADDFAPRMLPSTADALDRAFEGLRSGERPRCVSPFGVADLTGNVDEWTTSVRKHGYRMILKGGHSGFVRSRCRPATRGHGPLYVNHSQGFRCCQD